jgi:hypothetical protein
MTRYRRDRQTRARNRCEKSREIVAKKSREIVAKNRAKSLRKKSREIVAKNRAKSLRKIVRKSLRKNRAKLLRKNRERKKIRSNILTSHRSYKWTTHTGGDTKADSDDIFF